MKEHVLIISYVPHYNRQGYDLAEELSAAGYFVRLYQKDGVSNKDKGIIGVRCIKPHGRFHKLHMVCNFGVFIFKTLLVRKQIVVCVGKPMLVLGGLYKILFGSTLVWYSLEYSKLSLVDRFVYRKCVSGYIDVEENRQKAVFSEYGEKKHSLICYNMPHLHASPPRGGRLREYLKAQQGFLPHTRIVIYAGSYQQYACLDKIVEASRAFPAGTTLVLMAYGLPRGIGMSSPNCIVVPPVSGEEFLNWLADADCALLPYEDDNDLNVRNCSPQKLFDCYLVGVPYVASNRPITRIALSKYSEAGVFCDFSSSSDIRTKVAEILGRGLSMREAMRELHVKEFNYGLLRKDLVSLFNALRTT